MLYKGYTTVAGPAAAVKEAVAEVADAVQLVAVEAPAVPLLTYVTCCITALPQQVILRMSGVDGCALFRNSARCFGSYAPSPLHAGLADADSHLQQPNHYSGVTLNAARPDMNNYATLGVMLY